MEEAVLVLVLAVAIDRLLGEPSLVVHPTIWIGRLIDFVSPKEKEKNKNKLARGVIITLVVTSLSFAVAFFFISILPDMIGIIFGAYLLKSTISWRSLSDYTLPIMEDLERGAIEDARNRLPYIVGRDIKGLDECQIVSAVVESIGENTSDGIIAPIFYFSIFSLFSLPFAVGAAILYRAVNTMDSMLGYKKYGLLGMPPAKLDDILNFFPARITAVLFLIAAKVIGKDVPNGIRILKRDNSKTPSPNAGFPMAAMAGVLSIRLEKNGYYELGDAINPLSPGYILESKRIMDLSVSVFLMITLGFYLVLF